MVPRTLSHKTIKKHNDLVQASYALTDVEYNIIDAVLANIDREDTSFKVVRFPIREFNSMCGLDGDAFYGTRVRKMLQKINNHPIILNDNSTIIWWFASAEYKPQSGIIELELSEKLKPFLLYLKNNYTLLNRQEMRHLSGHSGYAKRIYELLRSEYYKGEWVVDLEKFRWHLGLKDKLEKFGSLKQRVLDPALKQINDVTSMDVELELRKTGRAVTSLIFKIYRKGSKKRLHIPDDVYDILPAEFHSHVIFNIIADELARDGGLDTTQMLNTIRYAVAYCEKDNKMSSYLQQCIQSGAGLDYDPGLDSRSVRRLEVVFPNANSDTVLITDEDGNLRVESETGGEIIFPAEKVMEMLKRKQLIRV